MAASHSIESRFWAKVDLRSSIECWNWNGAKRPTGYGMIRIDGKTCATHRIAYQLQKGEIPEGMEILHSCDNPSCCNPAHLDVGTHQQNIQDMRNRFRMKNQILTNNQVEAIRKLYFVENVKQKDIAILIGAKKATISSAIRGKNWANHGKPSADILRAASLRTKARPKGEQNPSSKLTSESVLTIRFEHKAGAIQSELAAKFQVSKMTISRIVRRELWPHI